MNRLLLHCFVLSIAILAILPAAAGDIEDCKPGTGVYARIAGCDALLYRKDLTADARAAAFFNRGTGYHAMSRYSQAIGDYTSAIELKPDYADAYFKRGLAYRSRAAADCSRAKELDAKLPSNCGG